MNRALAWPIEFPEENLLRLPQAELAVFQIKHAGVTYDRRFDVTRGILRRIVLMLEVDAGGYQAGQFVLHVLQSQGIPWRDHRHGRRRVRYGDQKQTGTGAALGAGLFSQRCDVIESIAIGVELEGFEHGCLYVQDSIALSRTSTAFCAPRHGPFSPRK